jgi:hypothetical protein
MTAPMINDGTQDREMTAEEIANYELVVAQLEAVKAAAEAKAIARQAVLDRLGLSADEAAALLG